MAGKKFLFVTALLMAGSFALAQTSTTGGSYGSSGTSPDNRTTGRASDMNKPSSDIKSADMGVRKFDHFTLTFDKGSAKISDSDMKQLKAALDSAKGKGDIKKVEVAAWSDKDHPTSGDLSKEDRKLADDRIDAVKKAIRD
jgi:outer membrane protein OmpA-like peptidoglycan-associated protein